MHKWDRESQEEVVVSSDTELLSACFVAFDYFKPSWKQTERAA